MVPRHRQLRNENYVLNCPPSRLMNIEAAQTCIPSLSPNIQPYYPNAEPSTQHTLRSSNPYFRVRRSERKHRMACKRVNKPNKDVTRIASPIGQIGGQESYFDTFGKFLNDLPPRYVYLDGLPCSRSSVQSDCVPL